MKRKFERPQTFDQDGFEVEVLLIVPIYLAQLDIQNRYYDDDEDEWAVNLWYSKL